MILQDTLKQTPLHQEHLRLNAKMVPFGGWLMPLQYEGILAEHDATRRAVTVFDTSHMGEFLIKGDCKTSGLDAIVSSAISDMPIKSCRYGMALNPKGGVIDDLIVYRIAQEEWMIVVNAGTMEKDAEHFRTHLNKSALFENISDKTGKLDIQGPLSLELLKPIIPNLEKLTYYNFDYFQVLGERVIVSRTGYTGELGFEIYFPWNKMLQLWQKILNHPKIKPAGLGARDVLRLEMGYSLYGHELEETISPLEAGLSKFVDLDKEFIGKEAIVEQKKRGAVRRLVAFMAESRRTARSHHRIYTPSLEEIGVVTSGSFSPSVTRGIGLGFIAGPYGQKGEKIIVGDDKIKIEAQITQKPFYKTGSLKN